VLRVARLPKGRILSVVLATSAFTGAQAQVPTYIQARSDATIKAFGADIAAKIFSNAYTPMRQEAVTRSARSIPGFACPSEIQVSLLDVVPYPVKPGAVSWIESYQIACTPAARRSFLLLIDGERVRIAELLPGFTITDPLLQRDASHGAKVYARSVQPEGCEKAILTDTRVPTPPENGGPWRELWSFDLCSTAADVEMTFTPSPRAGTTWSAKLAR
jgi:hypothetical protein